MASPTLQKIEKQSLEQSDYSEIPPTDIIAFNELRSCADLYRMHTQSQINIHPDFQRDFVWKDTDQTRFIDSLIKSLPIPSMCFALDYKEQKWIVIDGLQRISTIIRFLEGGHWKLSKLRDVMPDIAGKSIAEIKLNQNPLHKYYTRVENLSIPITVLRCNFNKREHMEYLFMIFNRLNTGGMKLNNQEIRNCIYSGDFNGLLRDLDKNQTWRKLNKMQKSTNYRYTKQELILRLFAFHDRISKYEGSLVKFLNDYMFDNRNPAQTFLSEKKSLFQDTINVALKCFPNGQIPKLSVTFTEALLIGIAKNLPTLNNKNEAAIQRNFKTLSDSQEFQEQSLSEGLSKKSRVNSRLRAAIEIFSH